MYYLENNWELNSERDDESSVVYYVLHYKTDLPYEDSHVYTEDGDYVRVVYFNDKYMLQNEPNDNLAEVCEYLDSL